jgi:quinol monooxygenase YgiN
MTPDKPVFEIAYMQINATDAAAFEAAVSKAVPLFHAARGCSSFGLQRIIEQPGHYRLVVGWTSVDAHMVEFRATEAFQAWRGLVGHFLTAPTTVQHVEQVIFGF